MTMPAHSAKSASSHPTSGATSAGGSTAPAAATAVPVPGRIVLTVFFDPQRTSPNHRLCWQAEMSRKQAMRTATEAAHAVAGRPRMSEPCVISITARRARRIDHDNLVAACKQAIDQAVHCIGLPNDGPAWVSLGTITQETGAVWRGREQVEFLIEARSPALDDAPLRVSRAHRESQVVGITNHLLAKCDALLALEEFDLPGFFRQAVLRAHADLAQFVGAAK
jgi:hypothetical protein